LIPKVEIVPVTSPYSEAYKEALASVTKDNPIVETLAIVHEDESPIYIANDLADFTAYLEDGVTQVTFLAGHFNLRFPSKDSGGVPQLSISVSNSDNIVGNYIERVKYSQKAISLVFRPYLSDDTTEPQMDPPLTLQMRDIDLSLFQANGKAVFARDLRNTMVPKEKYTRTRFSSLGE